jgi:alkylation response protein AidB-like acyl-CoA dehydrogenase
MDFSFTAEHEELRQTVRRFLERESPEAAVRALMESERGYDERAWPRLAKELGIVGLIVPEANGGAGLGPVELAIVMEEMGRVLFCAPYLSTAVLATLALRTAAEPQQATELLRAIAEGRTIATLAFAEEDGRYEAAGVELRAAKDGSAYRLDGIKNYVVDGHIADVILVAARLDGDVSLFRVQGGAPGLERHLLPTLDLTRKLARLEFSSTPAVQIGRSGDLAQVFERVFALAAAALAAEQVGGAQRCLEMSTEYAKTRIQFGRPIGSFQAIKHKCSDMLVEVELARSAAYYAGFRAAEGDDEELFSTAHMAKAYCSEAFFHAAAETIQIHGGMGFTWEHPAHLYFKRAAASARLFGGSAEHRAALASRLGL